jgi:hypothetical protein
MLFPLAGRDAVVEFPLATTLSTEEKPSLGAFEFFHRVFPQWIVLAGPRVDSNGRAPSWVLENHRARSRSLSDAGSLETSGTLIVETVATSFVPGSP